MPFTVPSDIDRCPCLSGEAYGTCCAPFHAGKAQAPTAERLMRSRYSAFVAGDDAYLLRTWQRKTRPVALDLDPSIRWYRLDILSTHGGGLVDREGTVEFRAFYRTAEGRGEQHEISRFVREGRAWLYVDAA